MQKKKSILSVLICITLMVLVFPITARGDMGPKPSVRIYFENMGDELCYGTLLSLQDSTGPSSAWDGNPEHTVHNENAGYGYAVLDYDTWKAFAEYQDADGYYFLQEGWEVSKTKEIAWTYYPPSSFKILLYYPETEVFVSSGVYERYAFDSYYTVDMEGVEILEVEQGGSLRGNEQISADRSYQYSMEILSLIARILITIAIEMLVALLFGFRQKKLGLLLLVVNTATQILLNIALNVINYNSGQMAFVVFYILLEFGVFVLEAVLYCAFMNKYSRKPRKKWFYILYALIANGVSFGAGMAAAQWIPGIF